MSKLSNYLKSDVAGYFTSCSDYWCDVYDKKVSHQSFNHYAICKRMEIVLRLVSDYAGANKLTMLDMGCGTGVVMEQLLLQGHTVYGIDISPGMVDRTKQRVGRYSSASCMLGDMERLPVASNSIDLVLCLGGLPYLHNDWTGVAEISRVLKPGGMGIIILPNAFRLGCLFDPYYYLCRIWEYLWHTIWKSNRKPLSASARNFGKNRNFRIRRYRLNGINRTLLANNLAEVRTVGVDYGPPTFFRRAILPETIAIRCSEVVRESAKKKGLTWLRAFSNQWVSSFRKTCEGSST